MKKVELKKVFIFLTLGIVFLIFTFLWCVSGKYARPLLNNEVHKIKIKCTK